MEKSKFQAISLFSGAGGLDIGCKLAGVDVKVAIDNDSDATETLKLNNQFKTTTVLKEDIKNFNPKKLKNILMEKNNFNWWSSMPTFLKKWLLGQKRK